MNDQTALAIAGSLGWRDRKLEFRAVSGGSIAGSWRLESAGRRAFVKTMPDAQAAMLDAERDGLERLAESGAIATPAVLGHGAADDSAWLALEWLELRPLTASASATLGRQLAELHRCRAETFGLENDNFIGATPQPNTRMADWTEFLFEHRLGFQLELLSESRSDIDADLKRRLHEAWQARLAGYAPAASLLHGDLWGGNAAALPDGQPALFDPAVHYGDRECDLAMADLFGGFDAAFFDAYAEQWPLEPGWRLRRDFYQLYHLLNHANLFGGHYVSASRRLIDRLAA
ncbi:MAG: fructosamine kinase family protein [Wenzhouxiangellaceae bacterium]|nr:fructosamine kinase family protein [Wenzhouxiangellaceae bacterium]MBS3747871.1 fructosamine kinase family protein [Wenzhouxiangellaceae bacterium]MBS3824281.1 fructosamine kinase family protein [Wenzhouxiangellaceae bacterium]